MYFNAYAADSWGEEDRGIVRTGSGRRERGMVRGMVRTGRKSKGQVETREIGDRIDPNN